MTFYDFITIFTLLLIASILNGIRAELQELNKKDHEERGRVYGADSL